MKMNNCKRKGKFGKKELHSCFVYDCCEKVHPLTSETCKICNWKKCSKGHCGCSLTPEARFAVDIIYKTFCEFCL